MDTENSSLDDILILEYAFRWYRYGGGDAEDIMVEFGMDDHAFYARVIEILARHPEAYDRRTSAAMASIAWDRAIR